MNRNLWVVGVAAAVAAGVVACAPPEGVTTGADAGGRTMHLTGWQDIDPWELRINIADMDGMAGTVYGAQTQTRDNSVIHQRARFYRGYLGIQHNHGPEAAYDERTTRNLNAEANLKENIREYFNGQKIEYEDSAHIRVRGERGGWTHLVRDPNAEGRTCIFGHVGFLMPAKRSIWTQEAYDVVVTLRDCSQKRSFSHVVDFLTNMKVVEPEYNRSLMAGR